MAGTIVSGTIATGISIQDPTGNPASITSTGAIIGAGVGVFAQLGVSGTLFNDGIISATSYGVRFLSSGTITNGSTVNTAATISGATYGVRINAHDTANSTVKNFGLISNTSTISGVGVRMLGKGSVINGAETDTIAAISGYFSGINITGVNASVANFGTIKAAGTNINTGFISQGVYLANGGTVTNGSNTDTSALITAPDFGVDIEHLNGLINNFGTISALGSTMGRGAQLSQGGTINNGSDLDTTARIVGNARNAIFIASGVVNNFGTITDLGSVVVGPQRFSGTGVRGGGNVAVANGSTADTAALIQGYARGVYLTGPASSVVNFGKIAGTGSTFFASSGIYLSSGGSVTNHRTGTIAASITGFFAGVDIEHAAGTVTNNGSISSTSGKGVQLGAGGSVSNGGTSTAAVITGVIFGVDIEGATGTLVNSGTITASSGGGKAAQLGVGGTVINGSDTNTKAILSAPSTGLDIEGGAGTVTNGGTIIGTGTVSGRGVVMAAGGSIINGSTANTVALISGINNNAAFLGANGQVQNFGTISDNSTISGSGIRGTGALNVVNGAETDQVALILGYTAGISVGGGFSSIANFGTIRATGTSTVSGQLSQGIYLAFGGSVTNGSPTDTAAYIGAPAFGVDIEHVSGTVVNFGTIKGTSSSANSRGVVLGAGGTLTNGSETSTAAYIYSTNRNGVYVGSNPGTVTNFGLIKSTARNGVILMNGGTVTNGSPADTTATINAGRSPIYTRGSTFSVVNNFGTLTAGIGGRSGVNLYTGNGSVTNGSATSTTALIVGGNSSFGVYGGGANFTVSNFGTIQAGSGIVARNGGTITNGSTADTVAVIRSTTGFSDGIFNGNSGALNVANFGTITGSSGISVGGNSSAVITNGTVGSTAALISSMGSNGGISISGSASANIVNFGTISGYNGVFGTSATGNVTVTNTGTIIGTGVAGSAVLFGAGDDRIIVSPGAVFSGAVVGGGGNNTIELTAAAGPAGVITGIGTTFSGFSTLIVDPAAKWNAPGISTIATIQNKGTLAVTSGGTLTAAIDPASTGTFAINAATVLDVTSDTGSANFIRFVGTGALAIEHAGTFGQNVGTAAYTGPTIKNFIAGDKIDLRDVAFGPGLSFNYDSLAGLLTVSLGGAGVASLRFDPATLGAGTFHGTNDGSGFTLITHS